MYVCAVYIPSLELGCGLGVTLAVAVLLFVLYRVYKLEVHLLYRSWFGTDERYSGNTHHKERPEADRVCYTEV